MILSIPEKITKNGVTKVTVYRIMGVRKIKIGEADITVEVPIPTPQPEPEPEPIPPEPEPEPIPIPEPPTPPPVLKPKLNAGYLFPNDSAGFGSVYAPEFALAGITEIMMMGVTWPNQKSDVDYIYETCQKHGLNFYPQPTDLGAVKTRLGVSGWANRIIGEIASISAAYPRMKGWFGAFDLEVTQASASIMGAGSSTNDTYLPKINDVFNAMVASKPGPIIFEAFNAAGDYNQYKSLLKAFLLKMDARSHIVVNAFITNDSQLLFLIKHAEACLEAGANYGIMFGYPYSKSSLPLLISCLESIATYPGIIRSYPDHLLNIAIIWAGYKDYILKEA